MEYIIESIVTLITSNYFIPIIVFYIVLAMFKKDKNLVTMIWILGTFSWIFVWLYNFDVHNITSSVPELIAWIKIAFITSIIWLSAAIILWFFETEEDINEELNYLKEIDKTLKKLVK
jgi:hypothetical protein